MRKKLFKLVIFLLIFFITFSSNITLKFMANGNLIQFTSEVYANVRRQADIVFVIDTTGSMGDEINNVKNNINQFVNILNNNNINVRLGLVEYKDIYADGSSSTVNRGWFINTNDFISALEQISVNGGGDGPESAVDALEEARRMDYQLYTKKFIVLVTDADYKEGTRFDQENNDILMSNEIDMLESDKIVVSVVGPNKYRTNYNNLVTVTNGIFANIDVDFSSNLQPLTEMINTNEEPIMSVVEPVENQIFSQQDTAFVPSMLVSDSDGDVLICKYYIDSESAYSDEKTITNTVTAQIVSFNAFDIGNLSEGTHVIKFQVSDNWDDPVLQKLEFIVDKSPPRLGIVSFDSSDTSITITGSANDDLSDMHITPYRYALDNNISQWINRTSYSFNSLIPNTRYNASFEAKDEFSHIATKENYIYTEAQIPNVDINNAMETELKITSADNNPSSTEYQVKIGSSYVNQIGRLTSTPTWITLNSKIITAKGLVSGKAYNITARARNHDGIETEYSRQVVGTTLAKPPSNITFEPSRNSIEISWNAVSRALSYDIEVDGSIINNGESTTYIHSGLASDTQHTYRVRVRNDGGTGNWSSLKSEYTLPNPPGIPGNISTTVEQTSITINWDPVLRADSYDIEVDGHIIDNGAETSFVDGGLQPETEHTYRIKAKNRGGESSWSKAVTEITLPYLPDVPTNISTEITKNSVTLTWDEMERATGYELEVDGLIIDNGENTTYLHDGLEPLTGHTYRVRAKNKGGKSSWSNQIDVTTYPEKPNTPTNVISASEENSITITWYKVTNAESYDIEVDGTVITDLKDRIYIHKGLGADTEHTYRVRAKNISGISEWSNPLAMSTFPKIDDGGSDLNIGLTNIVAVVTNNEITISWDAVAPNVEYEIEVDGVLKDNEENTIYRHSGLDANTFHTYKIRAKTEEGTSNWCGVLALSTLPDLPDAPKNIEAYPANNSIELRWERIEETTGYDVEVDGETVDNGANIDYLHNNLEPGTSHTYRVRAKNITGVTAWSPAIVISTTNPTYTVSCTVDKTFDLSLLASNVQDFTELKFIVTYNSDELEVVDLNRFTPEKDLTSQGKIPNTDLKVTYTPGRIEFTVDKSIVPGTSWSGEISDILFKAKVNGEVNIDFVVE